MFNKLSQQQAFSKLLTFICVYHLVAGLNNETGSTYFMRSTINEQHF